MPPDGAFTQVPNMKKTEYKTERRVLEDNHGKAPILYMTTVA